MTEPPCFIVKEPTDLQNEELKQYVNVRILNIYFKKLDDVPVHIQILTINNCQLQSIKNLFHLNDLMHFDVKHNMISDISGIVTHLQLEYFDFSFNNVLVIPDGIQQLQNLKTVISENNYIVNQEPLIQHVNFIVQWLQQQQIPEQKDFRKFLTPGTSDQLVNQLMNTENGKRERSQYLENMIKTLTSLIKGKKLIAKDLFGITHFGFVDCFDVDTLSLDHCPNLNFTELPKKIRHLSITNSGLYRIDGLENMKQLESIDLTNNKLISCKLLFQLPNLAKVNIQGNKIQDLEHITKLPKFQWNFILPQRLAYLADFQKYLGDDSSEQDALNLQKEMSEEQKKSMQIVYDAKQIDRLKGQVVNGYLEISSDTSITSFGFVDHWKLTSLKIVDCPNLSLERAPTLLTNLTITECGLKSTKGIEKAKLLKHLSLSNNSLTDLEDLNQLTALEELDLSFNQLYQIDLVSALIKLKSLNLRHNNLIVVKPVETLKELKRLEINENMIQDLECVKKLNNFDWEMISQQKQLKESDYQNYFEKIGSEDSMQEIIDKMAAKTAIRQQIVHDSLMIRKYKDQVREKSLVIQNDTNLLSIQFSDELDLQSLTVCGSQNLTLERVPQNIRHLAINNCNIKSTKGLAPAKLLISLDVSDNLLNDLTELDELTSLQKLDISFNALQNIDNVGKLTKLVSLNVKRNRIKIIKPIETLLLLEELNITDNTLQDLQYIKLLPKLKWEAIVKQSKIEAIEVKKQTEDCDSSVDEKGGDIKLKEEQKKSMQIVYDAKQIDRLKGQVVNGYLEISSDTSITSFGFVDHWKLTSLKIVDCPNLSLERAPTLLTNLTITECGLKSTKGIEKAKLLKHLSLSNNSLTDLEDLNQLTALEELDLSFNQLYQIDLVSALIKLKSLNLRHNNLIVVKPVETLKELKRLEINENMIQDLECVKKLNNFDWEMISQQKQLKESDYQNYFEKIGSEDSMQEIIDKMAAKTAIRQQIVHDSLMIRKYKDQVREKSLVIQNDTNLLSIQFSDELDLQSLTVCGSQNITLERVPQNIRHLAINNCNIKSTKGLAPAKLLISLDVSDNLLNDLTELDELTSLQKLDISFNALQNIDNVGKLTKLVSLNVKRNRIKIIKPIETLLLLEELNITDNTLQDLQYIKLLPKLKWEAIVKQSKIEAIEVKKQTEDCDSSVDEKGGDIKLKEEQKKSMQIVYDAKQIDRLKGQVVNGYLEISSDTSITSFGFVDHWKLTSLKIVDCPNLSLERAPTLLTNLTITECGLKSTKGIEKAKLLKHLSLSNNSLTDLEDLNQLTALEELDLSFNQLYQIDLVSALIKLKSLNLRHNNLIVVKPVITLFELEYIDINDNQIQDLQYVKTLPKLSWDMIAQQTEPVLVDYQKYLGDGSTEQEAKIFAASITNDQITSKQILYDTKMIRKFKDKVQNGSLEISFDNNVTSFGFVDQFKLNSLKIINCPNLTLERAPKILQYLTINKCGLQSTEGIQNATQLTSLNLQNNLINDLKDLDKLTLVQNLDISNNQLFDITNVGKLMKLETLNLQNNKLMICKPLEALKLLTNLQIDGNMILDMIYIKKLDKFNWDMITEQNEPNNQDYHNFFNKMTQQKCSEALIQGYVNDLTNDSFISKQIIHDALMKRKYQTQVHNGKLIIQNDPSLQSIEFVDYINIKELIVMNCYNLILERCPKKALKLTINSCNLSILQGIEHMVQLTDLNLSMNQLKDISLLASLINLTHLDLGQNNIENINVLTNFKNLISLDLSQNLVADITAIAQLTQLQILDLSYNFISSLDDLSDLTSLVRLNVSKNNIVNINSLKGMINLVYLNISFNKIISLEICKQLSKLHDLRLESNLIQNFEPIAQLQNVNKYWISNQLTPSDEDYMRSYNCTLPMVKNFINQNKTDSSQNKLMLINKYKNQVTNDSKLSLNNEQQLNAIQFTDILKVIDLEAINCQTISFDDCPKLLLRLKLNNCIMKNDETQQYITNIYQLSQLTDIDLSNNHIQNIEELGALTNLKSVNLLNNIISRVAALKDLNLTYLNLQNNKIIFQQPLSHFSALNEKFIISNNFISDNFELQSQQEPTIDNFKNVLGPNSTEQQAAELMNFVNYDKKMRTAYKSLTENNRLIIKDDQNLFDIQFTRYLNIKQIVINNCANVQITRKYTNFSVDEEGFMQNSLDVQIVQDPINIRILKINNCGLTHLIGIERMRDLTEIDIKNNKIVSIKQIQKLSLEKIQLGHNIIVDMNILTSLKNYKTEWIQEQDEATDLDYTRYLEQTNANLSLKQFKQSISETVVREQRIFNIYLRRIQTFVLNLFILTRLTLFVHLKTSTQTQIILLHITRNNFQMIFFICPPLFNIVYCLQILKSGFSEGQQCYFRNKSVEIVNNIFCLIQSVKEMQLQIIQKQNANILF
ncbi:Leucine_rich repeats-containing protein [Hexamita inflata]|uniref:Leucine rich repeats-containing protein n=1 Tax=Hexamita inflata TaxID=28002 RepID=A0AA86PAL9_9EUKA|nr:Leucine rich repeats-containing protein [Hexamita inflata]